MANKIEQALKKIAEIKKIVVGDSAAMAMLEVKQKELDRILESRAEKVAEIIDVASEFLPEGFLEGQNELELIGGDPPGGIFDFLYKAVNSKINQLAMALVENGPKIAKEGVKIIIRNKFSNIKNDTIDSTQDAIVHYYTGDGRSVTLGSNTVESIKNSEDINRYRKRIEEGLTSSPASGSGLAVDMTYESTRTFHLGRMTMSYETVCNGGNCTTTYTVDDNGFVDPNVVGSFLGEDDNDGPNNELMGMPYDYEEVTWSENFTNPGYNVGADGKPLPITQ
ncbi:MAG: Unknown protein [uncultured Sulfurovum sp.]|uniref:Uncharacterized protein n=1 Tax=uncultured Sulfurovum sp. TaxID=269237 RepID=A0A6S6U5D3_9BACT|nr:MAG: Unknown protein [uncultured Sulfurovum sp.]